MKNKFAYSLSLAVASLLVAGNAFAQGAPAAAPAGGLVAVGAGLAVGLAILGAALGQSKAASAALDSIGRNPSAAGKVFLPMILSFVFIEALGILGFVIAFFLQQNVVAH